MHIILMISNINNIYVAYINFLQHIYLFFLKKIGFTKQHLYVFMLEGKVGRERVNISKLI